MTVRSSGMAQLAAIIANEDAPQDVRDAAKMCYNSIGLHRAPARDLMDTVLGWINKQQQQDRYGK